MSKLDDILALLTLVAAVVLVSLILQGIHQLSRPPPPSCPRIEPGAMQDYDQPLTPTEIERLSR